MAPLTKSNKKKKDSKKLKKIKGKNMKNKSINIVPAENKGTECNWWDSFWHKNSQTPGIARMMVLRPLVNSGLYISSFSYNIRFRHTGKSLSAIEDEKAVTTNYCYSAIQN